uniref:Retinol dehydrogenase n=1 Tax=Strigamia maritima TaxID=126957 RepID=T1J2M0_STRMM
MFLDYYVHLSLMVLTATFILIMAIRIYFRRAVVFKNDDRMDGKTVIITGANSGIGQACAMDLAKRGAKVILACRDRSRRDSAPFAVRSRTGNVNVRFMYLDLTSLDSIVEFVHQFTERETRLDILINNAAILCPKGHTMDGLDMTMGVNVFGHFLLTHLLLDIMKATSGGARIINLVSEAYKSAKLDMGCLDLAPEERNYSMYKVYCASKLALVLLTTEMAKRFYRDGITAYAADPGVVNTQLLRNWPGTMGKIYRGMSQLFFRSPEDSAHTIMYCALTKGLEKHTGKYFYNCRDYDIDIRPYGDDFCNLLYDKIATVLKSKNFYLSLDEYPEDD